MHPGMVGVAPPDDLSIVPTARLTMYYQNQSDWSRRGWYADQRKEADLLGEPGLEGVRETAAEVAQEHGIRRGILWITNVGPSGEK